MMATEFSQTDSGRFLGKILGKDRVYLSFFKPTFDFLFSLLLLIVLAPLMFLVAVAIKIESPGSVFFVQTRSGINGKNFKLIKFRSMTARNDVYDPSRKDEVTRVGHLIRKFSIDEIPQLLNVIKGDMALIGPRPWLPEYYQNMNESQRHRYKVKPGITGLAQASGRNAITIFQKIECDLEYVKRVSFIFDLKIMVMTLKTMFDESTIEIGKTGILDELELLKKQILGGA